MKNPVNRVRSKLPKPNIPVHLPDDLEDVKGFFGEFRKFIARGNVVDLAVGVVIGTAFKDIVNSLVQDVILPPIGLLTNQVDFTQLYINLGSEKFATLAEAQAAGAPLIQYGMFINSIIDFVLIAFVIFIIIKQLNRLERKDNEKKPKEKKCPYCYSKVHIKATRCPNCTSELREEVKPAPEQKVQPQVA